MKNSHIFKLTLYFFIIIFFYTVIILVVVVKNELSRNQTVEENKKQVFLESTSSKLDQQIQFSLKSVDLLSNEENTKQFANETTFNYQLFSNLYDSIHKNDIFFEQSPYSIGVLNNNSDIVVSSDGYFFIEDFVTYIGFKKSKTLISKLGEKDFDSVMIDNKKKIVLISEKKVEYQDLIFFVYWDNTQWDRNESEFEIIDDFSSSKPIINKMDNEIFLYKNGKSTYLQKKSEILPLISYRVILNDDYSFSTFLIPSIFVPFILLLIIGIALLIIFQHKFYKPYVSILNKVKESDTNETNLLLLDYFRDILSCKKNLEDFDTLIQQDLVEIYIKNMFNENYSIEEIKTSLKLFDMEKIDGKGSLIYFTFSGKTDQENEFTNGEIIKIRRQVIKQFINYDSIEVVSLSVEIFILIVFNSVEADLSIKLDKLQNNLQKNLQLNVNFIFSKSFSNLEEFLTIFNNMNNWIEPSLLQVPPKKIDFSKINSSLKVYTVSEEQILIQFIKVNDYKKSKDFFEEIINRTFSETTLGTDIGNFATAFSLTIKRILSFDNKLSETFFLTNKKYFDDLEAGIYESNTKEAYILLFNLLIDAISNEKKETTIDRMIQFINNNYQKDISLTDIANKFHLTEPYVSKIIKEHLNVPFKTYLNKLRVETSKKLLKETNDPINSISEKVGFKNVNSYIRVFKQFEGTTPGNYRKQKK